MVDFPPAGAGYVSSVKAVQIWSPTRSLFSYSSLFESTENRRTAVRSRSPRAGDDAGVVGSAAACFSSSSRALPLDRCPKLSLELSLKLSLKPSLELSPVSWFLSLAHSTGARQPPPPAAARVELASIASWERNTVGETR